jgi:hypothetical protein
MQPAHLERETAQHLAHLNLLHSIQFSMNESQKYSQVLYNKNTSEK